MFCSVGTKRRFLHDWGKWALHAERRTTARAVYDPLNETRMVNSYVVLKRECARCGLAQYKHVSGGVESEFTGAGVGVTRVGS